NALSVGNKNPRPYVRLTDIGTGVNPRFHPICSLFTRAALSSLFRSAIPYTPLSGFHHPGLARNRGNKYSSPSSQCLNLLKLCTEILRHSSFIVKEIIYSSLSNCFRNRFDLR